MSNVLVQENVFEVEVTCGETVVVTMPGATGERGTIDIGTTSTVNPDQPAAVENVGTLNDAILNFDIPRGSEVSVGTVSPTTYSTDAPQISDSGANGDVVLDFTLPRAATVAVGDTDTVGPLSEASVINSGSNGDVVLNFEIPRGSLVSVGTVSTVEYGVPASVTNSGVDGDSILNFSIPSGPISKVTEIRGRTTLDSAVDTVAINISGFTETTDILYVFVNSIYVSQGQDYTVSGANIVRSSGTWAVGTVIDFVCLRSILIPIESLPETNGNTPIKFPATQSASSDPNTLDDYEEGTWTPTTSTPNLTISINNTSYTKIGNMVFAKCYIVIENTSGSTIKSYNISGLPFFSFGYGFATSYFQGTQTNQYIETHGNYSNWQQDLSVGSNLRMYQFVYNTF